MTSELHFKLYELLLTALPKEQAMEAVSVLEKSIDQQIGSNKTLAAKEDIKELRQSLEHRMDKLEENFTKMIYWVSGAIIAQSAVIVALLKALDLVK